MPKRMVKEELETSNRADNAVYCKERLLRDNQENICGNNRGKVGSVLDEVKEALKGSDAAAIKMAGEKLNETGQTVSAELYKAASEKARAAKAGQFGNHPEAEGPPEDRKQSEAPIIDAEVEEEKKAA